MNDLEEIVHYYYPIFAALASLREIFRVSLNAAVGEARGILRSWLRLQDAAKRQVNARPAWT